MTAAASVGVALRLPFFDAPLTADEGGYAEIARLWSHGYRLYRGVWVDRPQGLILVFRGARGLGLVSASGFRAVAAGFAVLLVILSALVGERTGGWGRGLVVAALVATAGASPFVESFALSGELIASVVTAAAILLFVRYTESGRASWLLGSGLCAGSAWMVKQSAVDAAVTVGVCLALRRCTLSHLALFVSACAAPIVTGVLASGDPGAWYRAVIGYGLHASGTEITLLDRWTQFRRSLAPAAKALGPVAALAAFGWRRAPTLARVWLAAATVGVLLGGGFHAHYYLQLVVPLAFVAAFITLSGWSKVATVVAAATGTLAFAAPLWNATDAAQARAVWPVDTHLQSDVAVARFVRKHSRPSQQIYVLWAAADVYYLADRRPALPYLWYRNTQTISGAIENVRRLLDRRAAALVVTEQSPSKLDPSGATAAALHRNFHVDERVDGVDIYGPTR